MNIYLKDLFSIIDFVSVIKMIFFVGIVIILCQVYEK